MSDHPETGLYRGDVPALLAAFERSGLDTPSYVLDQTLFRRNGEILKRVQDETGAKILLAQKAFSCFGLYPLLRDYLVGTAASGLHEARLGHEEFGGEVHVFSPAFKPAEMTAVLKIADHLVFNSLSQWQRYREEVLEVGPRVSAGLRINPEYSEAVAEIYDPCAPGSRFGVLASQLEGVDLTGLDGLHFHTLCEQGASALGGTLRAVMEKFDDQLQTMKWLNFGGGHLITSPGYDIELLIALIREVRNRYPHLRIYLEPGEAIAVGTGVLLGTVIDLVENSMPIAILDLSATTHMPDVLEMPYRPVVEGAGAAGEKAHTYRLGGPTCLAGDIIGDYSFDAPLQIGDRVVFHDMSHYTMVKTTTFNGVPLPSIAILAEDGRIGSVREFGYEDYRMRLG
ncbi:MAG: carboxynorspermidine decarboxylase [Verrucomicrobiales bacterium]|jgi:carboxynorspermidine decarboxylase|nr:carboxynorspermidine decarboxylase [Verrucomicrobiales bacterium]MDP4792056.1 carboxynorspermidine decarboxylase [Verrucomicrobiales bacterium]